MQAIWPPSSERRCCKQTLSVQSQRGTSAATAAAAEQSDPRGSCPNSQSEVREDPSKSKRSNYCGVWCDVVNACSSLCHMTRAICARKYSLSVEHEVATMLIYADEFVYKYAPSLIAGAFVGALPNGVTGT